MNFVNLLQQASKNKSIRTLVLDEGLLSKCINLKLETKYFHLQKFEPELQNSKNSKEFFQCLIQISFLFLRNVLSETYKIFIHGL